MRREWNDDNRGVLLACEVKVQVTGLSGRQPHGQGWDMLQMLLLLLSILLQLGVL